MSCGGATLLRALRVEKEPLRRFATPPLEEEEFYAAQLDGGRNVLRSYCHADENGGRNALHYCPK